MYRRGASGLLGSTSSALVALFIGCGGDPAGGPSSRGDAAPTTPALVDAANRPPATARDGGVRPPAEDTMSPGPTDSAAPVLGTSRDASVTDAPPPSSSGPRACKGSRQAGAGGGPVVLRTDMALRKVMALPGNATRLARDPLSQELFVLTQNGQLLRLTSTAAGTASSTVAHTAAQIGLAPGAQTLGMAFGPDGTIYLMSHVTAAASATTSRATIWKGVPSGGGRTFVKMAETAPYPRSRTYYDHEWSGLAVSPDGKFLFANAGSRTDHGEVQTTGGAFPGAREGALTAAIFKIPTSAANLTLPNDEAALRAMGVVFARGLRNSFDPEFAPNGDLLAGDNGPDADYHEELNWLREGEHYGFPWRLGNEDNAMASPTYTPTGDRRLQPEFGAVNMGSWRNDPAFPARPAGLTFAEPIVNRGPDADELRNTRTGAIEKASTVGTPYATFSDHGSPLGLTFDRGEGALCADFSGGAFILRYGKAAGQAFEPGRDLLHLALTKGANGYTAATTQIVRGFSAPIDAVLTGDRMYVLDRTTDGNGQGALWEITLPNGR